MAQIKAILEENDIAGCIALHSPGHVESFIKLNPSYSCAMSEELLGGEQVVRFRSRLQEDFDGNAAKMHQSQADTVNMFTMMSDVVGYQALGYMHMMDQLKTEFEITNTDMGFTSGNSQNN